MIPYPVSLRRSSRHRRPWHRLARVCLETLECRAMPSLTPWPGLSDPLVESDTNDTADLALDLGTLDATRPGEAVGTVGGTAGVRDPEASADVDWLKFSLDRASRVVLTTLNELAGTSLVSVLTLYNQDTDHWGDPQNPTGNRLLAQTDAGDGPQRDARIVRDLPAGTYFVAVSGSGNRDFHPYLANSGQPGSTGDYGLLITATDLGLDLADGPSVVSTDPEADSARPESPLVVRVTFSEGLDPSSLPADPSVDDWVQLRYDAAGDFTDGADGIVSLSAVNFSAAVNELQLTPTAPLQPGFYQIFLAGDSASHPVVLRDLDGSPLGSSTEHPDGADFTATFQINGSEGTEGATPVADDTQDTAHALGELAVDQFALRRGAIGDDPAYDPTLEDPFLIDPTAVVDPPYLFNPAADVDVYSFQVRGEGSYLLIAEVWAGRIGSPLDPGLSLYRNEGPGQAPTLLAANDSTLNPTRGTDGSTPLFSDSTLFWNLPAGDYFVAVSAAGNVPAEGAEGVFDPLVSHSGRAGFSLPGSYVLSLGLRQDTARPEVLDVIPADGATLDGSPTRLTVRFSEFMNLQELGMRAFSETSQSMVNAVWVEAQDGTRYFPRYDSFDTATNEASFLMLDSLPSGAYTLHLSGSAGLTDLAGNPLTGTDPADPTSDYVASFTVTGPEQVRDADGRLLFTDQEPNDSTTQPQDLCILFPHDIQAGVVVTRDFSADPASAPADRGDSYRFEVLQGQNYLFLFSNHTLPAGTMPRLEDSAGNPIGLSRIGAAVGGGARLLPGVYTLSVSGWTLANAANVNYELHIQLQGSQASEPPVATGALAASRFRLITTPPATPATPDQTPPAQAQQQLVPGQEQPPAPPAQQSPPPAQTSPPPPLASGTAPPQTPAPAAVPPAAVAPPPAPQGSVPAAPAPAPLGVPSTSTGAPPPGPSNPLPNSFLPQGPANQPLGPSSPPRAPEQPTLPPQSSVLLVTIVAPTVPESVAPRPAVVAPAVNQLPQGAVVPGLLSSLRSGPMGGVHDPGPRDPAPPVLSPNSLTLEPLLTRDAGALTAGAEPKPGGLLLTLNDAQVNHAGNAGAASTVSNPMGWQQALEMIFGDPQHGQAIPSLPVGPQMRRLWNATIDALFTPPESGEDARPVAPLSTGEQAGATELDAETRVDLQPSSGAEPEGSWAGQGAVAVAGALAAFDLHRRGGERGARKRRHGEEG